MKVKDAILRKIKQTLDSAIMNSCALASLAACSISNCVALTLPKRIFS